MRPIEATQEAAGIDVTRLGIHPQPAGVTTRGGRAVAIYRTDAGGTYPIHGAVLADTGASYPHSWAICGLFEAGAISSFDLIRTTAPVAAP